MAAALPGGDPLAAVVAAGETPSPELVAAAGQTGSVSQRAAVMMLIGVGLCLVLNAWLADQTSILRASCEREDPAAPAHLEAIARDAVKQLDYKWDPADSVHGFMTNGRSATFWYRQRREQPFVMDGFWPQVGDPKLMTRARPTFSRPPMEFPDEVALQLTPDGLLRSFRALPGAMISGKGASTDEAGLPWQAWFSPKLIGYQLLSNDHQPSEVGADYLPAKRIAIEHAPVRTPPDAFDALAVWRVEPQPPNQDPVYIEAAAFQGRPVFFSIVSIGQPTQVSGRSATSTKKKVEGDKSWAWRQKDLLLLLVTAGLAWRNLRIGRSDRRSAMWLTQVLLWFGVAAWLTQTRHLVLAGYEIAVVTLGLAQVLFSAAMIWLTYIGFEPFVRRYWPELLISAMRLLRGHYRDPLVGRDLLAGALAGMVVVVLHRVNMIIHQEAFGGSFNHRIYFNAFSLLGARELLGCILDAVAWAMTTGWEWVVLIVFVRLIVRSEAAAVLAGIAMATYVISLETQSDFRIAWLSVGAWMVLNFLVIVRLGLLSWVTVLSVYFLACTLPVITLDAGAWYFGHGLLANAAVAAIATYGFIYCRDRRPDQLDNEMRNLFAT